MRLSSTMASYNARPFVFPARTLQEGDAVYEGKGGSARADAPKGSPFGYTSRLSRNGGAVSPAGP